MLRSRFETVGMTIADEEIASFRDTLDTVSLPATAVTLVSAVKAHVLAGARQLPGRSELPHLGHASRP